MNQGVSVVVGALLLGLHPGVTAVANASPAHGNGDDAMPGTVRVYSAQELPKGVSVSLTSGYGFTGETLGDDDTHHRGAGGLAAAYSLSKDLALGFRMDGRYDKHFAEAASDDGWVGDPRIFARYRQSLGESLSAGVQLGLWAPGSDAPSIEFDAISAELVAAVTWSAPASPLQVSVNAGYRLDRSAASVTEPERLSLADRMSLGLSDFNAVIAGIGASYQAGPAELVGEVTLDFLHGSGAPSFRSSPMRVAFGARHELSNGWYLFGNSEVRLSRFRGEDAMAELIPFTPKVSVVAGLQLRFGHQEPKTLVPITEPVVEPPPVEEPTVGSVAGSIISDGAPVANASLVLVDEDGKEHTATTDADGRFQFDDIPLGAATLRATADGYELGEKPVDVGTEVSSLELMLVSSLPPGQLRGQVRSFRGVGLASTLTIEPGEHSIRSDEQGNFELDLPPGDYEVSIAVDGFKAQTRSIHIDENGVTILNVDIRKRDRKRGGRK